MAKLSLLLLGLVFLAVTLQGGHCLTTSQIRQSLESIRDSSTSTGHTQFAGVKLMDRNKMVLYENMRAFPDTSPTHTEEYLLNDNRFNMQVNNAKYAFIYTRNSPCVSSRASRRTGRTSCTTQIRNFASQERHLTVYVGFQIWYGQGNRFRSAAAKEQEFMEEACRHKPLNLQYMYMPRFGAARLINCNRRRGTNSRGTNSRGSCRGRGRGGRRRGTCG